jgi:hypothetical protein
MDGRKYQSTIENPNSLSGPEILGLPIADFRETTTSLSRVRIDRAASVEARHYSLLCGLSFGVVILCRRHSIGLEVVAHFRYSFRSYTSVG